MSIRPHPLHVKPVYRRYTWVGNRIDPETMARLYRIRKITGKPITIQVAEAVRRYVKEEGSGPCPKS